MAKSDGNTADSRKRGEKTREQYLAESKERQRPWEAEGVSRRTYYRYRHLRNPAASTNPTELLKTARDAAIVRGARLPAVGENVGNSATNASSTSVARPARKTTRTRRGPHNEPRSRANETLWTGANGRKLIRLVEAGLEARGLKQSDRKAVVKVIEKILPNLPKPYRELEVEALRIGYYAALKSRPTQYDQWVFAVRQWGAQQWDATPEAPYDFVDELITIAGPTRAPRLDELFEHLKRQWGWDGRRRLTELRRYCDGMMGDPLYLPKLRLVRHTRGDDDAAAILALMHADPKRLWTISQLAGRLRKTVATVHGRVTAMRRRGDIVRIDEGKGLLGAPRPGVEIKGSASRRIIETLVVAPDRAMGFLALRAAVGTDIARPIHTLRGNGALAPADPSRRAPVKLSASALAKIARGEPIRDRKGSILWAPLGADR
jgi:hypothetical protein